MPSFSCVDLGVSPKSTRFLPPKTQGCAVWARSCPSPYSRKGLSRILGVNVSRPSCLPGLQRAA